MQLQKLCKHVTHPFGLGSLMLSKSPYRTVTRLVSEDFGSFQHKDRVKYETLTETALQRKVNVKNIIIQNSHKTRVRAFRICLNM